MPSKIFNRILVLVFEGRSEISFRVFLRSFFYSNISYLIVGSRKSPKMGLEVEKMVSAADALLNGVCNYDLYI